MKAEDIRELDRIEEEIDRWALRLMLGRHGDESSFDVWRANIKDLKRRREAIFEKYAAGDVEL